LELLLIAVRDGRIHAYARLAAGRGRTGEAEADIAFSDIGIQPLPQIAALEGEGQ
jgi:hypothetical protein